MPNNMTRNLSLVHGDETIQAGFLGRTITAATGFSKELFRNGRHEASIRHDDPTLSLESLPGQEQYKAKNGDRLLTINLGPTQLTLKGIFYTKDNYSASYEVLLELKVNNPSLFAQRYAQESDPVNILQMGIIQEYDTYAARTLHNMLDKTKLRHDALYNRQSAKVGITVAEIYKSEIYADPRKARINELEREAEVQKSEITITSEVELLKAQETRKLDDITRAKTAEENHFKRQQHHQDKELERQQRQLDGNIDRQQKDLDNQLTIQQQMRQQLLNEVTTHLITEMKNKLDEGMSVDEVLGTNPLLRNMLPQPLQTSVPKLLEAEQQSLPSRSTHIRERQDSHLPPPVPPQNKGNSPKTPIPQSDTAEYSEVEEE